MAQTKHLLYASFVQGMWIWKEHKSEQNDLLSKSQQFKRNKSSEMVVKDRWDKLH